MDARWLMSLALLGAGEAARTGAGSDDAPVAALSRLGARVERDPTAPDKPAIAVDLSSTGSTDAPGRSLRDSMYFCTLVTLGS
jgi:hypothetical protein